MGAESTLSRLKTPHSGELSSASAATVASMALALGTPMRSLLTPGLPRLSPHCIPEQSFPGP